MFDAMEIGKLEEIWLHETNARLAVQTLIDSLPVDLVAGKMCDQTGDCFWCYSQFDENEGSVQVFPEVKKLYESAAHADLMANFVWKARSEYGFGVCRYVA